MVNKDVLQESRWLLEEDWRLKKKLVILKSQSMNGAIKTISKIISMFVIMLFKNITVKNSVKNVALLNIAVQVMSFREIESELSLISQEIII